MINLECCTIMINLGAIFQACICSILPQVRCDLLKSLSVEFGTNADLILCDVLNRRGCSTPIGELNVTLKIALRGLLNISCVFWWMSQSLRRQKATSRHSHTATMREEQGNKKTVLPPIEKMTEKKEKLNLSLLKEINNAVRSRYKTKTHYR